VRSVQRGYAACARQGEPCVAALVDANAHLIPGREQARWAAALPLIAPPRRAGRMLGAFDPIQVGLDCTDPARREIGDLPCTDALLDPAVTTPR